jgi:hypothetical protein
MTKARANATVSPDLQDIRRIFRIEKSPADAGNDGF